MSPVLPFDIFTLIIDIVEENKDTDLLKELALVSHSFHQICTKHLFATIELHDYDPIRHLASSKKGFAKLLKSRPDVVKYIRKLTYIFCDIHNDDHPLPPILLKLLPTFSGLNCFTIKASDQDWNALDSSLTSAFLRLMHHPTINHIKLLAIQNFPLSSLTPSVNLHRLDICNLRRLSSLEEYDSPEIVLETMPKIREFHTAGCSLLTKKLLHAKTQDGKPAFNFMDLRQLSIVFYHSEDEQNTRYIFQNAKLLENFRLSVSTPRRSNLAGIVSLSPRTLKVLELTIVLDGYWEPDPLGGLCEGLEALVGHNMLESLSIVFCEVDDRTEDFIGFTMQKVEKVLVKPGWSALKQVFFKIYIASHRSALCEALQSLPDKYLSHLSKLESIAFNYSAHCL